MRLSFGPFTNTFGHTHSSVAPGLSRTPRGHQAAGAVGRTDVASGARSPGVPGTADSRVEDRNAGRIEATRIKSFPVG
jgi:hypothetical protein